MRSLIRMDIFRSTTIILFGAMIVYYHSTSKLELLIHPNYILLVAVSGWILTLLGCHHLFSTIRSHSTRTLSTDEESSGFFSHRNSVFLLLLPIFFGLYIQPKPLSVQTALSRGISYDLPLFENRKPETFFQIDPEKRELIDWINVFNHDPEPGNFIGQKVKVTGFVLQNDKLPANYFLICRFYISCCVADARPVGLPVHFEEGHSLNISNDRWLEVEGRIMEGVIDGKRYAVIRLEDSKEISPPKNPYVY